MPVRISLVFILATCAPLAGGQVAPSAPPKADRSNCANISAQGNVNCNVTITTKKPTSLKGRTEYLASQILDFVYFREGPINSWKQQAIAQAFISAMKHEDSGQDQFRARLLAYNEETQSLFISRYWTPQIVPLLDELRRAGVDTSLVAHATASGDPREVAFMLSVLSSRIGGHPPFARTLTDLEASSVVRGFGNMTVEVFAVQDDANSIRVAETLRRALGKKSSVSPTVEKLETSHSFTGVHIVVPSGDLERNLEGIYLALKECGLDPSFDLSPAKQPPTIIKIEVWRAVTDAPEFPVNQLIR